MGTPEMGTPEMGAPEQFVARLRAALPRGWFADRAPVLEAVLAGFADGWARLYALLAYVRRQGRIGSAEGAMLDLIAGDFFGPWLRRRTGQGDDAFRAAIGRELLRERATRGALAAALTDLTGRAPAIFEPSRPADTGAWGMALGYGVAGGGAAGGYGSLALPFQCFVTAWRPAGAGIAGVAGYEGLRADGLLDSRVVSSRTTGGAYFDAGGVLREAPAGVARMDFSGGAPLLLQEPAGANQVRNPRAEAAAAPGTLPTYWGTYATNGLTMSVAGSGVENGIPYVDLRWAGVAAGGTATATVFPEAAGAIAGVAGQSWTASVFVRLVAGAAPANLTLNVIEANGTGQFVAGSGVNIAAAVAAGGRLPAHRASYTRMLAAAATASTYLTVTGSVPVGTALDFTLRVGAPQVEQAAAASSVMLPPAGSPGVSARSAEAISIPATLAGGYGGGAIEYASAAMVLGQVTDADIYDAVARTMPAAAIAWTRISS
jgi:hypothetical protein